MYLNGIASRIRGPLATLLVVGLAASLRAEIPLPPQIIFGFLPETAEVTGVVRRAGLGDLEVPAEIVTYQGASFYVLRIPMETDIGAPGPSGEGARAGDEIVSLTIDDVPLVGVGFPLVLETGGVVQIDTEPPENVDFVRADCNASGTVEIGDPMKLLFYLFRGRGAPGCQRACDSDGNGTLEINDSVLTLRFLFTQGPPPATPYPGCGSDNTALTCVLYDGCPVQKDGRREKGAGWIVEAPKKPDASLDLDALLGDRRDAGAYLVAGSGRRGERDEARRDRESRIGVFDPSLEVSPLALRLGEVEARLPAEGVRRTVTVRNALEHERELRLRSPGGELVVEPATLVLLGGQSAFAWIAPRAASDGEDESVAGATLEILEGDALLARLPVESERDPRPAVIAVAASVLEDPLAESVHVPVEAAYRAAPDVLEVTFAVDPRVFTDVAWVGQAGATAAVGRPGPGEITVRLGRLPDTAPVELGALVLRRSLEGPLEVGSFPVEVKTVAAHGASGRPPEFSSVHGEVRLAPGDRRAAACRLAMERPTAEIFHAALSHVFGLGPEPDCYEYHDRDGDGTVRLEDITSALAEVYRR